MANINNNVCITALKALPAKFAKKILRKAVRSTVAMARKSIKSDAKGSDKKTVRISVSAKGLWVGGKAFKKSVYANRNEYGQLRYAKKPLKGGRKKTKLHGKMKSLYNSIQNSLQSHLIKQISNSISELGQS